MADHLVSLPGGGLTPETRASLATLALAASFSLPGNHDAATLERELLTQFAGATSIDSLKATNWLESGGASILRMDDLVSQFATNPAALHTALQQHNDAGGLVLLIVQSPDQLADAVSGAALHAFAQGPLWLLRSGYSDDPPYGFYYDLLASASQPVKILWPNVASAEILAAIALEAPTPPLDVAALLSTLQAASDAMEVANQSIAAAQAAHATILASLGKG